MKYRPIFSLLLLAILSSALTMCSTPQEGVIRTTELYAVKGSDSLYMDRYTYNANNSTELRPAIIFIFGGGFTGGDRCAEQYEKFFDEMATSGIDVISIDYRLGLRDATMADFASPEGFAMKLVGTIRMAVEDLYSATAYTIGKSEQWGIDPNKIIIAGSSAGAITALQGEYMRLNQDPLSEILGKEFRYAGVISCAGAIFELGSELTWSDTPAPMLLFHGDADKNVPYGAMLLQGAGLFGSEYISNALKELNTPHHFYSFAELDHVIAESPLKDNLDTILNFIESYVTADKQLIIRTHEHDVTLEPKNKEFSLEDYIQTNYMPKE